MKYVAREVLVEAFEIKGVGEEDNDGSRMLKLESGWTEGRATREMMARMTPKVGDYWVVQEDGYVYLNSREVFLRKYRPAE